MSNKPIQARQTINSRFESEEAAKAFMEKKQITAMQPERQSTGKWVLVFPVKAHLTVIPHVMTKETRTHCVDMTPTLTLCQKITALDEDDHSPLDESMVNELAELVAHLPMITALASAVRDIERLGILAMTCDATKEDRAKQAVRKAIADLKGIA